MAALVPQVTEHRAVRLVETLAHGFAVRVVGLDDVHRQLAAFVADNDGIVGRRLDSAGIHARVGQQPKAQAALVGRRPERQLQLQQRENEPALRSLRFRPQREPLRVAEVWYHFVEPAREAVPRLGSIAPAVNQLHAFQSDQLRQTCRPVASAE